MNISSNLKRKKFKDFKYKNLLASYVAGICNVLTVTPLSVISTQVIKLQKTKGIEMSFLKVARMIYKKEGISGFYKGILVSIILVFNPMINLTLKSNLQKAFGKSFSSQGLRVFLAGAISKLVATIVTYPYTTIKVNQQGSSKNLSVLQTIFKIYVFYGYQGFYKGIGSKLTYTVLNNALMFMFFDMLKKETTQQLKKMKQIQ